MVSALEVQGVRDFPVDSHSNLADTLDFIFEQFKKWEWEGLIIMFTVFVLRACALIGTYINVFSEQNYSRNFHFGKS